MSIYNEPPPCMCIVPHKDDMTMVSCFCFHLCFSLFSFVGPTFWLCSMHFINTVDWGKVEYIKRIRHHVIYLCCQGNYDSSSCACSNCWFYSFLFVLSIHVHHCILINKQPLTCPCHLYSSFLHLEIFCWYSFYLLTCTCIDTCIILKITVWTFNFPRHSYNYVLLKFFLYLKTV